MMLSLLKSVGFSGVEALGEVIFARSQPHLPEFTATPDADGWGLAFAWPLRATAAQIEAWNDHNPSMPMDLHLGETRIRTHILAEAKALQAWAAQIDVMVAHCTEWRRATRQRDEGM